MTDALRGLWGTGNFFALSRSAWLGTAKFGHAMWSGDTDSSWAALAAQVPTGLGAGLSGIGLWTHDLGGERRQRARARIVGAGLWRHARAHTSIEAARTADASALC